MQKELTWTPELAEAVKLLANETETKPYRENTDADVKSRAREYLGVRPGTVLQPHQVEYTICLLQRLDMDYDKPRASHAAFKKAWEAAHG